MVVNKIDRDGARPEVAVNDSLIYDGPRRN